MKIAPFSRTVRLAVIFLPVLTPLSLSAAYGDLLWSAITGDVIFGAPAIGPSGEVVVGSQDGSVHAFNPDGSTRWIFSGAGDWIDSGPTLAPDGTVYAGSWDHFLYAIDGETGGLLWKMETGGLITGSPAIGPDGTVYIGSHDGLLYAVNPDGTLKWLSESIDSLDAINSSPVLNSDGSRVYYGNDSGEFLAIDTADGSEAWVFAVTDIHPAGIDGDTAISGPAAIGSDGGIYFACENSYLYALTESGGLRWSYPASETIRSAPVVSSDETLHFAAQDGYLYTLDTEGFQLRETFVGDVFYCTPAIDANGNMVIAGYAGSAEIGAATRFTAIDSTGSKIWEYIISGYNDSSPNIAPDGSIYIGAHDGFLYKFEGDAPLMSGQWPRFQATRRQTGHAADLPIRELVDVFPAITQSSGGWASVPWFGSGAVRDAGLPWVEHAEHGFLYAGPATASDLLYYDANMNAWLYAQSGVPGYLLELDSDSWLYHLPGSTVAEGRLFYDFTVPGWISPGN